MRIDLADKTFLNVAPARSTSGYCMLERKRDALKKAEHLGGEVIVATRTCVYCKGKFHGGEIRAHLKKCEAKQEHDEKQRAWRENKEMGYYDHRSFSKQYVQF